jgi:division/cell wall cluster transcriptional repressor MraZ
MPTTASSVPEFHGVFRHGIDGSRRVMIPAKWRPKNRKLVFRVIMWPIAVEEFLLVLPPERWQLMLDKIKTGKLHDPRTAVLERVLGSTSAPLSLDSVGRFCLPGNMADKVGIVDEAEFIGRLDKFEIWTPSRRRSIDEHDKQEAATAAKEMDI